MESLDLEVIRKSYEKLQSVLSTADEEFKEMIERSLAFLRSDMTMSAERLAENKLGIARSTFFYRLKKYDLTFNDLRNAAIYEANVLSAKRRERRWLVPKTLEEFKARDCVVNLIKLMKSASLTDTHIQSTISFFYRICKKLGRAPEEFWEARVDSDLRDSIKKELVELLSQAPRRSKRGIISMLQTLQKHIEVQLLPSSVEQEEYKGDYTEAELSLEARDELVKLIVSEPPNSDDFKGYDVDNLRRDLLRALIFLYYTCSRREALTNFMVIGELKATNDDVIKMFNEDEFVAVRTEEKGKKSKKFSWTKIIPKSWFHLTPRTNFTQAYIKELSKLFGYYLKRLYELRPELFNKHTLSYVFDVNRRFHLLRHTAARDALRASRYNMYLVSKLGGWLKADNLKIYGDFTVEELLRARREHYMVFSTLKKEIEGFLQAPAGEAPCNAIPQPQ